jgi:hypothetical protein
VADQDTLDFQRADTFAATVDLFLQPAGHKQEAVVIQVTQISRSKPSIVEAFGVCFLVFVARAHVGSANFDLAGLAGSSHLAVRRADPNLWTRRRARRPDLPGRRRERAARDLGGRFGHAVGLDDGRAKQLLGVAREIGPECGGAATDRTQRNAIPIEADAAAGHHQFGQEGRRRPQQRRTILVADVKQRGRG